MDYLEVKTRIEEGDQGVDDGERVYKMLFEDFFSKEEIEELIKELIDE